MSSDIGRIDILPLRIHSSGYIFTLARVRANAEANGRDIRVGTERRRTGNSYLLSGNPRNPGTNSHGPLSRVNSRPPRVSCRVHLPSYSPGFLFYSLFSINVFSFPRSQNFLIISAKMRDPLFLVRFNWYFFFFFAFVWWNDPGSDPNRPANPIYRSLCCLGYF